MISDQSRSGATPAPAGSPAGTRLCDLPPVDDRYYEQVWLRPGDLLRVCDELGAQTLSVVDDEVTFIVRSADLTLRWRGRLDGQGVARL